MIKITRFFYIHWLVLPLVFLSYLAGGLYTLLTAYSVVAIHELFHLFAALLVRERVGTIIIMPFGITVRLSKSLIRNTYKEIFIAASGPVANVLMLCLSPLLARYYGNTSLSLILFNTLNWAVLLMNLLPCLPLDGGRIVKALLTRKIGYISAVAVMRRLSRAVICCLGILCGILLILTKLNISLVMTTSFLTLHLSEEQKQNEYIIMQELLYNKDKLRSKGLLPSRVITAMDNVPARDVFKLLSYDSYCLIHIVDGFQNSVRTVTEARLVSSILEKGWHICLQDV
ncbi:MAG: hypothetical protein II997_08330 [Clostridia bacterium]|nr:hypothetical protein [Clostridia bacterium]